MSDSVCILGESDFVYRKDDYLYRGFLIVLYIISFEKLFLVVLEGIFQWLL